MECYLAKVGFYWDGEKCVDSCPALIQNRVCTDCPESTPIFDKDSRKCRKCSAATDGGDFWDAKEKKCVAECPRAIKDNVCKSCAEANPAAPIWVLETRVCRPCTDADGGPFWDPATQRCYSVCPDTAPKATAERTCRKCDELQDKGHFWDGTDCVSVCPFTWDANGVCRTCAEMDSTKPFWSVKECSDKCPYRWSVDEKDQQCVRDCGDSINMTVDDHGLAYTRCTGEQECHGFY